MDHIQEVKNAIRRAKSMSKTHSYKPIFSNHKLAAPISNYCWLIYDGYDLKLLSHDKIELLKKFIKNDIRNIFNISEIYNIITTEETDLIKTLVDKKKYHDKYKTIKDREDYLLDMQLILRMSRIINKYIDDNKIVGDNAAEYWLFIFLLTCNSIAIFEKLK